MLETEKQETIELYTRFNALGRYGSPQKDAQGKLVRLTESEGIEDQIDISTGLTFKYIKEMIAPDIDIPLPLQSKVKKLEININTLPTASSVVYGELPVWFIDGAGNLRSSSNFWILDSLGNAYRGEYLFQFTNSPEEVADEIPFWRLRFENIPRLDIIPQIADTQFSLVSNEEKVMLQQLIGDIEAGKYQQFS